MFLACAQIKFRSKLIFTSLCRQGGKVINRPRFPIRLSKKIQQNTAGFDVSTEGNIALVHF